jgi:hypothetical protein
MHAIFKHKLLIGATALAVAAFAGGAYAATTESNANSRQAFLDDVAKRLKVKPAQLSAAMRGASLDRLDAAVKAGALTQAQADRIRQRIEQGGPAPFFLGRPDHAGSGGPSGRGLFGAPPEPRVQGPLAASAQFLGLTDAQLFDELRSGKSLAQIATAHGKSVSGLEQAISEAMTARLNRAVADGMISKGQEQQLLKRLSARIDRRVNRPMLRGGAPAPSSQGAPPAPPGPPAA